MGAAGVMYLMVANFVGQLAGYAFMYLKKPMAVGAIYFAGKNHEFLSEHSGSLMTYLRTLIG